MTLPNWLTIIRIVLSIWFGLEYCGGNPFLAFFIFLGACVSDLLDGYIARKYGQISNLGKLLDPLADKILLIIGIGCLVYSEAVSKELMIIVLLIELVLMAGSIYYLKRGTVVYSGKYGKAASLFFTAGIGSGILGIGSIVNGFLIGAVLCSLFATGYYFLYFSN